MDRLTKMHLPQVIAVVALLSVVDTVAGQELFSVNIWSTGRPGARGGVWGDEGSEDPTDPNRDPDIDTLWLEPGEEEAGVWETEEWDNYQQIPFTTSTAPMEITGSEGSTATIEVVQMRNSATYMWDQVRDDTDAVSVPNATLLGSLIRGTEFDEANGGGAPFPARIVDVEVRDLPFTTYDVVVYVGTEQGRGPGGTIRVNDEIPEDPTDKSGLWFNVLDGEPNGELVEIVEPGGFGNFVLYEGLTDETLRIQVWGEGFNHVGIAGVQILDADSGGGGGPRFIRGDADATGEINLNDGVYVLNFLFLGGPQPSCLDAADADNDDDIRINDAIYVLNYLFLGGLAPIVPFPGCGTSDIEGDVLLGCEESACP